MPTYLRWCYGCEGRSEPLGEYPDDRTCTRCGSEDTMVERVDREDSLPVPRRFETLEDTFRRIFRAPIRGLPPGECLPSDNLDPTNPNLSREEWAETRTCQVCGIAGEDVSASRRCSSCEKHDIRPLTRWQREHPECL